MTLVELHKFLLLLRREFNRNEMTPRQKPHLRPRRYVLFLLLSLHWKRGFQKLQCKAGCNKKGERPLKKNRREAKHPGYGRVRSSGKKRGARRCTVSWINVSEFLITRGRRGEARRGEAFSLGQGVTEEVKGLGKRRGAR